MEAAVPGAKRMRLRYDGTCRVCGAVLAARTDAIYERSSRTVRCLTHEQSYVAPLAPSVEPVEVGIPGASARREFERRREAREQRIRAKHPKLGGLIHALSSDPQSTQAWDAGALGEERLGRRLSELSSETLLILHDRRIPRTRANIDHIAVTRTGVWVIDAKKYTGRPHLKLKGGMLRPRGEKLLVGTRDCTKLVDGVLKQVEIVRNVIGDDLPAHGVLCFVEADWPLIGGSFTTRGVDILRPKKLYPKLTTDGPVRADLIEEACRMLAAALPSA